LDEQTDNSRIKGRNRGEEYKKGKKRNKIERDGKDLRTDWKWRLAGERTIGDAETLTMMRRVTMSSRWRERERERERRTDDRQTHDQKDERHGKGRKKTTIQQRSGKEPKKGNEKDADMHQIERTIEDRNRSGSRERGREVTGEGQKRMESSDRVQIGSRDRQRDTHLKRKERRSE
jgi:hypothetical protein